jgi:hypothetical protein
LDIERAAYTVNEFCGAREVSRAKLYELWRDGKRPDVLRVGSRVLSSNEAANRWRSTIERPIVSKCASHPPDRQSAGTADRYVHPKEPKGVRSPKALNDRTAKPARPAQIVIDQPSELSKSDLPQPNEGGYAALDDLVAWLIGKHGSDVERAIQLCEAAQSQDLGELAAHLTAHRRSESVNVRNVSVGVPARNRTYLKR